MTNGVEYKIIVSQTGAEVISQLNNDIKKAAGSVTSFTDVIDKMGAHMFRINQLREGFNALHQEMAGMIQPGIDFEVKMKELEAIGDVHGKTLKEIGKNARELGIAYGIDAGGGAEAFKLMLSQLSPELAKSPEALRGMGKDAAILSKQMGGDMAGAAETLTAAMNSYAIDLTNPIRATGEMTKMMNMMSAASKAGAAELPDIKGSLATLGVDAKNAGLSMGDTLAAIEVLAVGAQKKGSEAGTVFRNILIEMNKGRFIARDVRVELQAAGVDIFKLGDASVPFIERLKELKKIQGDKALLEKFVSSYNLSSMQAMLESIDQKDPTRSFSGLKTSIKAGVGNNDAQGQADIIMDSTAEKLKRLNARIKDFGININESIGGIWPFMDVGMRALNSFANIGGAIQTVSMLGKVEFISTFRQMAASTLGFTINMIRSGAAMAWTAATGLAEYVGGLILAIPAQWGLNIAMDANPIGLMILGFLAIGAAVAAVIHWWDDIKAALISFTKFAIKLSPFYWLVELTDYIFPGFKKYLFDVLDEILHFFSEIWDAVKGLFGGINEEMDVKVNVTSMHGTGGSWDDATEADDVGGNTAATGDEYKRRKLKEKNLKGGGYSTVGGEKFGASGSSSISNSLGSVTGGGSSGGGTRNVTVNIHNLVSGGINLHAATIKEGMATAKDVVLKALVDAVRDGEVAIATS